MWRPTVLTSLLPSVLFLYFSSWQLFSRSVFSRKELNYIIHSLHSKFSSICIPFIREKLYFTLFAVTVYSNKSRKLIRFWHIFSTLIISKYFYTAVSMLQNLNNFLSKKGTSNCCGLYRKKTLAQRFPKFENYYHSSPLPVFWSHVAVHSGTNRPVGSFSRSLRMNESYGAISLPGNEKHI